jgi:hypothetical protein
MTNVATGNVSGIFAGISFGIFAVNFANVNL